MNWDEIKEAARILIVDDEEANIRLLERMLDQAGFRKVLSTTDPQEVVELHREIRPDIILLDLHMPQMDGLELLEHLQGEIGRQSYLPILVLTADVTPEAKLRALLLGAKDFLTKPIDRVETMLRIRILLETRFLFLSLQGDERTTEGAAGAEDVS